MSNTDQKDFYQRTDITGESYEPMQAPRFTEVATFMRTPLVESLDGVDIGIIGIPYDGRFDLPNWGPLWPPGSAK